MLNPTNSSKRERFLRSLSHEESSCLLKVHWSKQCISIGIEVQQKAVGSCEKPWGPTTVAGLGCISLCLTSWGVPGYAFSSLHAIGIRRTLEEKLRRMLNLTLHGSTLQKPDVFLAQLWKSPASILQWWAQHSTVKSIQMAWLAFWITPCSLKHPTLLFGSQESLVVLRPKKCWDSHYPWLFARPSRPKPTSPVHNAPNIALGHLFLDCSLFVGSAW